MTEQRASLIRADRSLAVQRSYTQLGIAETDLRQLPSGLVTVDHVGALRSAQHMPTDPSFTLNHGIFAPRPVTIQPATDAEVIQLITPTLVNDRTPRSPSEIASAVTQPALFLAREAEKTVDDANRRSVQSVLHNLRMVDKNGSKRKYRTRALYREEETQQYFDRDTQQTENRTITKPGALEKVAIAAIELLDEPEFHPLAEPVVLAPLNRLFANYRQRNQHRLELPEMPDLTQHLIQSLDHFANRPSARRAVYALLGQIMIPSSMGEPLMQRMDKFNDLNHPLAFQQTLAIAESNPDSAFIKTQQERRAALLTVLQLPNQEVFERFDELNELTDGLVFSGDPAAIKPGKVGMEIELQLTDKYWKHIHQDQNSLPEEWRMGQDGGGLDEMRRSNDHLDHNLAYAGSLNTITKWLTHYASHLRSLHLHFDRQVHPHKPDLGQLFAADVGGRTSVYRSDRHYTWEIRSVNLPRSQGNLHPARLEDVIQLYLAAASQEPAPAEEKLRITDTTPHTMPQLIFGHIATVLPDPEGRLSALMALKDPMALRSINPLSFVHSVDHDSLPSLIEQMSGKFTAKIDLNMLSLLDAITKDEFARRYVAIYNSDYVRVKFRDVTDQVMGKDYVIDALNSIGYGFNRVGELYNLSTSAFPQIRERTDYPSRQEPPGAFPGTNYLGALGSSGLGSRAGDLEDSSSWVASTDPLIEAAMRRILRRYLHTTRLEHETDDYPRAATPTPPLAASASRIFDTESPSTSLRLDEGRTYLSESILPSGLESFEERLTLPPLQREERIIFEHPRIRNEERTIYENPLLQHEERIPQNRSIRRIINFDLTDENPRNE